MDHFEIRELQNDIAIERQGLAESKKRAGEFIKDMESIGIKRIHGGEINIDFDVFLDAIGEEDRNELGRILVERLNGQR